MTTAPMNPLAGPAGPGKYSTRTDNLEMGSIAYGEGKETAEILSGAKLAKTGGVKTSETPTISQAPVTGLYEPTQRPNEPITQGIDIGEGAGSNILSMAKSSEKLSDILVKMLPYDTDGSIGILYQDALARGN